MKNKKIILIIINVSLVIILIFFLCYSLYRVTDGKSKIDQSILANSTNIVQSKYKVEDFVEVKKMDDIKTTIVVRTCDIDKVIFKNIPEDITADFILEQQKVKDAVELTANNLFKENPARRVDIKSDVVVQINKDVLSVCYEIKIPISTYDETVINAVNIDLNTNKRLYNLELMQRMNYNQNDFAESIYNRLVGKDLSKYVDLEDNQPLGDRYNTNKYKYINRVIWHINDLKMYIKDNEICCESNPYQLIKMLEVDEIK